ncbi:spore coat associated protein CotJA [Clostridium sp. CX1]|uniref:Spore coat associated protein CotJA n=1 Tax=Clostridium tanneri TaxID=3037988 RepID=A0ABU4JXV1_9CLOT|nr:MULTISPECIES: spore coat associated protein CotJA [unclassified Clostridium]MCT8978768.1 spore coat associated protein CotJA [Clostridium sp. CX1]MDW8802987.1 spore coat associated protein CotJA [Clostridium sp. A1-XYC3]
MAKDKNVKSKMYIGKCPSMGKCIPQELVIRNVRLAAAYVPYQKLCTLLSPIEALRHGTAFPELYSPYEGKDRKCRPVVKC